jgi:nitroreductase
MAVTQKRFGRLLRKIRRKLDRSFAPLCVQGPWRSSLYYLFNASFRREHQGVLQGKLRYKEEMVDHPTSSSSLLRNIHRLEKGLIMRPRREIFGLAYIEQLVGCYTRALKETDPDKRVSVGELKWSYDVLKAYFTVTGSDSLLDRLRSQFLELPAVPEQAGRYAARSWTPYARDLEMPPSVAYADLLELAYRRRSVRWFLPKPVPRDLIEQAVAVAAQSPSACNRQPFEFRVFDDQELVQQVSSLPGGTDGFNHNFPMIIVVLGRLRNYFDERDRHLIYIDGSLAAMSFVLAVETLGLSSCCINWPDYPEREQRARVVLNLDPDERPVMFIAVGYPDPEGLVPYSEKKPNDQLCRYNFE